MSKKILILIILLATGIVGGYFGYKYYLKKYGIEKDVLAQVGDKKIYQKDLNERIYGIDFQGSPDNPTLKSDEEKKAILEELIEWEIAELEASKLGIYISDDELTEEIYSRLGYMYNDYTSSQKELTRKTILNDFRLSKIKEEIIGWREGKFILARFDKTYEAGEDINDIEIAKVDKEYAQNLINQIYQDITSGKISFEQGMEKADSDPKIGMPAWNGGSTYTFSRKFSKEESKEKDILAASPNFWDEIFKLNENEISEPKTFSIIDISEKGEHEAFFAIIKIDKAGKGEFNSFEDWLSVKKNEYNVKYYYNNL